jgi:hypothetical protein
VPSVIHAHAVSTGGVGRLVGESMIPDLRLKALYNRLGLIAD